MNVWFINVFTALSLLVLLNHLIVLKCFLMFFNQMFETNDEDLYFLMQKRICSQYIKLAAQKLGN